MSSWSEIEGDARDARHKAMKDAGKLDTPRTPLEQVAYWSELADAADAARWEAIGDASDVGHPWWTIGLAAGADPEGLRQKYRRRTSS